MAQLFVNIVISTSLYALLVLSFSVIYQSTKVFHIAHAVIITLGAYFTHLFYIELGLALWLACPLSIISSALIALLFELIVYRQLRKRGVSSWRMFVASIGIYIIFQNLISIIWGDESQSIRNRLIDQGYNVLGAYITEEQLYLIGLCCLSFLASHFFFRHTSLGKEIKAVSFNKELSTVVGIDVNRIIIWSYLLGSSLAASAGILTAMSVDFTPHLGFNIFLYSIVALIVGGLHSKLGHVLGSFFLALSQHLASYWIGSQWMNVIAYIILILFLILRPYGFSGVKLRKVTI